MKFVGVVKLIHEKNDRQFLLDLPIGCPFEEAHSACLEMAEAILEMQKQQKEAAEKAEAEKNAEPIAVEVVDAEIVSPEITE